MTHIYMPLYDSHSKQASVGRRLDTGIVEPISFNTNQLGGNIGGVQCISTGKFERDILNLLSS